MKRLAIVTAINEEYKLVKSLLKQVQNKTEIKKDGYKSCEGLLEKVPVTLVMTSMGMKAAKSISSQFFNTKDYCGALIVGYCGGLKPSLKVGDPVVATESLSTEKKDVYRMDPKMVEELGKIFLLQGQSYHAVPFLTVPKVVQEIKEKIRLHKETEAEAVDMEVAEVVGVAREKGLMIAAIKFVIDDVNTDLPDFNTTFEKTGHMDDLNVAKIMMAQPKLAMTLKKNMSLADESIAQALPDIATHLYQSWSAK